jgi:lactoylglutathione lyase
MKFDFTYTAIRTRNLDRSLRFYLGVLGMGLVSRSKTPIGEFAVLETSNSKHTLEINYYPEDSPEGIPYNKGNEIDHLAFKVCDVDEAVAFCREKGFPPIFGPETFGDWRVAYLEDPDGIWIELVKDTPAHDSLNKT